MLKHGRGTEPYGREAVLALSSMTLAADALGGCLDRGPMLPLATDGGVLRPWAVRAVHGVLQQLSQREAQVVRMRYGIGTRMHSVAEIGERLGVMPSQVERIELRAFRKLRDTSVAPELHEGPVIPQDPRRGGRQPALPGEPPQSPDEPMTNPWDEV